MLGAGDPTEATTLLLAHHGAVRLVLTDLVMPVMNGTELRRTLGGLKPGLPFLYMSGFADDVLARSGHDAALDTPPVLHKPFTLAELARAVRRALRSP